MGKNKIKEKKKNENKINWNDIKWNKKINNYKSVKK
jgi:hypothetical protein